MDLQIEYHVFQIIIILFTFLAAQFLLVMAIKKDSKSRIGKIISVIINSGLLNVHYFYLGHLTRFS